jgi:hypothetical protein
MDPQSSIVLSHGLAVGGQQSSIGPTAEISAVSCDLSLNPNPPPIGSIATEVAIRIANMVRVNDILQRGEYSGDGQHSVKWRFCEVPSAPSLPSQVWRNE